jgi:hypothetical protein
VAGSRPFLCLSRVVLHQPTVNNASLCNLHQPYCLCNLHIPTHVAASSTMVSDILISATFLFPPTNYTCRFAPADGQQRIIGQPAPTLSSVQSAHPHARGCFFKLQPWFPQHSSSRNHATFVFPQPPPPHRVTQATSLPETFCYVAFTTSWNRSSRHA